MSKKNLILLGMLVIMLFCMCQGENVLIFADNDQDQHIPSSVLLKALSMAAALEHAVMAQYLYAASSLKTELQEFSHPLYKFEQFEMVRKWKAQLLYVAREEMQHWSYACMIALALGGEPNMHHKAFPYMSELKFGHGIHVNMTLEPFSIHALQRFEHFEAKHGTKRRINLQQLLEEKTAIQSITIADLYMAVFHAIEQHDYFEHKTNINTDEVHHQFYKVRERIKNRRRSFSYDKITKQEALQMIAEILEDAQGFMPNLDQSGTLTQAELDQFKKIYHEQSHMHIFQDIRRELDQAQRLDPLFEPARNLISNPQFKLLNDDANLVPSLHYRTNNVNFKRTSVAYRIFELFDMVYSTQLLFLRQWHTSNADQNNMRALSMSFFTYMTNIISPLMQIVSYMKQDDKRGEKYLGPSFSREYLAIPKLAADLTALQKKNMQTMIEQANALANDVRHMYPNLTEDFEFVRENFALFFDKFNAESSVSPPKHVEDACIAAKVDTKTAFAASQHVLVLKFKGYFGCRLATNPDSTVQRYGISGKTYAPVGTTPLDRIIRFQDENGTISEDFAPSIGVYVTSAVVKESSAAFDAEGDTVMDLSNQLRGSAVSLLNDPKFESRNGILSEMNEIIDPFGIQITSDDGQFQLERHLHMSKPYVQHNDAERNLIQQARGPQNFPPNADMIRQNLQAAKVSDIVHYMERRQANMQHRYNELVQLLPSNDPQVHLQIAQYKLRLHGLHRTLDKDLQGKQTNDRLFGMSAFRRRYQFFLNGKTKSKNLHNLQVLHSDNSCSLENRWVVEFAMFFFDYDAKVGIADGALYVPVKI